MVTAKIREKIAAQTIPPNSAIAIDMAKQESLTNADIRGVFNTITAEHLDKHIDMADKSIKPLLSDDTVNPKWTPQTPFPLLEALRDQYLIVGVSDKEILDKLIANGAHVYPPAIESVETPDSPKAGKGKSGGKGKSKGKGKGKVSPDDGDQMFEDKDVPEPEPEPRAKPSVDPQPGDKRDRSSVYKPASSEPQRNPPKLQTSSPSQEGGANWCYRTVPDGRKLLQGKLGTHCVGTKDTDVFQMDHFKSAKVGLTQTPLTDAVALV
jgi:hypothetical protein